VSARKRRKARGRSRGGPETLGSLLARCPECGVTRREVVGPEDLPAWAFGHFGDTVQALGAPGWMFVCDRCERVGFAGMW